MQKGVKKASGAPGRHLEALLHTIAVAHNRHGGARRASGILIDAVRAMSRTSRARAVPVVARANCFYSGEILSKRYASPKWRWQTALAGVAPRLLHVEVAPNKGHRGTKAVRANAVGARRHQDQFVG